MAEKSRVGLDYLVAEFGLQHFIWEHLNVLKN